VAATQGGGWVAVAMGVALTAPWLIGSWISHRIVTKRVSTQPAAVQYEASTLLHLDSLRSRLLPGINEPASSSHPLIPRSCSSALRMPRDCTWADLSSDYFSTRYSTDASGVTYP
jgi:hypothetical protein